MELKDIEEVRPFPLLGITLRGIAQFVDEVGRDRLIGLTTTEVCEQFVKPITSDVRLSYCDYYLQVPREGSLFEVREATVFISHAWKYPFLEVFSALNDHFPMDSQEEEEAVLWFDLFSNSQHGLTYKPPPFSWWCETFMNAIKRMKKVVMIMIPWDQPFTLTRSWCLWEVYCSAATKTTFEIAMTSIESEKFRSNLFHNRELFYEILNNIDLRKCQAFNPLDRDQINEVVKLKIGFDKLNKMVISCLRKWFVDHLYDLIQSQLSLVNDEMMKNKVVLAYLLSQQGSYKEAETMTRECIAYYEQKEVLSDESSFHDAFVTKMACMQELSTVLSNQGLHEEAIIVSRQMLQLYDANPDYQHSSNHISTISNLASQYSSLGNHIASEQLHRQCYEFYLKNDGEKASNTLKSQYSIAWALYQRDEYHESYEMITKVESIYNEVLGPSHPLTLQLMRLKASVLQRVGNNNEAKEIILHSLDIFQEKFGEEHPDTLQFIQVYAEISVGLNDWIKAEELYSHSYNYRVKQYGETHENSLTTLKILIMIHRAQGKYTQAMNLSKQLYQWRKQVNGENHLETRKALELIMENAYLNMYYCTSACNYYEWRHVVSKELTLYDPDVLVTDCAWKWKLTACIPVQLLCCVLCCNNRNIDICVSCGVGLSCCLCAPCLQCGYGMAHGRSCLAASGTLLCFPCGCVKHLIMPRVQRKKMEEEKTWTSVHHEHPLRVTNESRVTTSSCDVCGVKGKGAFYCKECNWDLCEDCVEKEKGVMRENENRLLEEENSNAKNIIHEGVDTNQI